MRQRVREVAGVSIIAIAILCSLLTVALLGIPLWVGIVLTVLVTVPIGLFAIRIAYGKPKPDQLEDQPKVFIFVVIIVFLVVNPAVIAAIGTIPFPAGLVGRLIRTIACLVFPCLYLLVVASYAERHYPRGLFQKLDSPASPRACSELEAKPWTKAILEATGSSKESHDE